MSTASKRKGSQFETDFVKYMRTLGYDVERLPLSGTRDVGDVVWRNGGLPFIFELKNVAKANLTDFVRQAREEAANYAAARGIPVPHFAVAMKKRSAPISEAFVIVPLSEYISQVSVPF